MGVYCYRDGENIRCVQEDGAPEIAMRDGRLFDLGVPPGTFHELEFFKRFDRSFGIVSLEFDELAEMGVFDDGGGVPMPNEATFRHWQEPRVIRRRYVPLVASMDADGPTLTTPASMRVETDAKGRRRVWLDHRATGAGHELLMPPELDVEHSYGHKGNSGVNDGAACPDAAAVSDSAFALWSDEIEGTTRGVQINCGVIVPGTINPGDGWFLKRNGTGGKARIAFTDATGSEIVGDLEIAGTVTIGQEGAEYTLPAADGTAGQVLKTDGAGTVTWQDP